MPDNLIENDFSSLLDKPAGFFILKEYWFKKHLNKKPSKDEEIEPPVYWRFIDEVSAFTKK